MLLFSCVIYLCIRETIEPHLGRVEVSSAGCLTLTHSVRHFWKVSESDVEYRLHVSVHGRQQGHVEKSTEGMGKGDTGSC